MGKKGMERRNYSKEFKAEAAALAEKREKPTSQIAEDLGVNESHGASGTLNCWTSYGSS
jgi:transposase-like protein